MLKLACFRLTVLYFLITITRTGSASKEHLKNGLFRTPASKDARTKRSTEKCLKSTLKLTFPDVDYALLGYNVLKGFPLHDGHDPGFTYPIFTANYTSGQQSADCRYSVPGGIVVIPDVSCTTSFSSTVIETGFELQFGLSMALDVSGNVPVDKQQSSSVAFEASAGFKTLTSIISSGKNVLIVSSADCRYYFSKLNLYSPPKFSPDFQKWIHRLDSSNDSNTYMNFFDYYGTHFPVEVIFGARFIYKYQMDSYLYRTEIQNDVNVAASASYAGEFSVSGGVSMAASHREAASSFLSKVTVSRVSTGAPPPAKGDVMTWASTVKQNPVPVKYKLNTIDRLFSPEYMNELGVNYERIGNNIRTFIPQYCSFLQERGHIDICRSGSENLPLQYTKLSGKFTVGRQLLLTECISHCKALSDCTAISFCKNCKKNACRFFSKITPYVYSSLDRSWTSVIIRDNINNMLKVHQTKIIGIQRGKRRIRAASKMECAMRCYDDKNCIAFTYCYCPEKSTNCQLFAKNRINHLHEAETTASYILSKYIRNITREEAKTKFSNSFSEMVVESTKLSGPTQNLKKDSMQSCLHICLRNINCMALSFSQSLKKCHIFIGIENDRRAAVYDEKYVTVFLRSNIPYKYEIPNTAIHGGRHPDDFAIVHSKLDCSLKCVQNPTCSAISYTVCPNDEVQCNLYSDDNIASLNKTTGSISIIFSSKAVQSKVNDTANQFFLDSTRLYHPESHFRRNNFQACKQECTKRAYCVALTYDSRNKGCYTFTEEKAGQGRKQSHWKSLIVRRNSSKMYKLQNTDIAVGCNSGNFYKTKTSAECLKKCLNEPFCVAISIHKCVYHVNNCKLFREEEINTFEKKTGTETLFLSKKRKELLKQLPMHSNLKLKSTRLWRHNNETKASGFHSCETKCKQNAKCVAVSYNEKNKECQHFYGNFTGEGTNEKSWQTTIFSDRIRNDLQLKGTDIYSNCAFSTTADNMQSCSNHCRSVIGCLAVTFTKGRCNLFEYDSIERLDSSPGTDTSLISNHSP